MKKLIAFPFFLFLLPLFFVLHGYGQNKLSMTMIDCLELVATYLLAAGIFVLLGYFFFRNWMKAAVFSSVLLGFDLFFGAMHDALKQLGADFFLAKYSVLLPIIFVLFFVFVAFLRRTKAPFYKLTVYLNLLFLVLIFVELPSLLSPAKRVATVSLAKPCDTCAKPDVYLVIADEYADSISLAEALHFNNEAFQESLRSRGFHVVTGSRSNYNFTPFAVASLFQMDFLKGINGQNADGHDRDLCAEEINHNPVVSFFEENGYAVKNFSIFNLADQPTKARQNYILIGKDLVRSQTFTQRLKKDLGYHLVTTLHLQSEIKSYLYYTKECNEKLLSLLQSEVKEQSSQPRFVYTHLLMPHYPYYNAKNGKERPFDFFQPGYEFNGQAYVEYLQYCNSIFLEVIDTILKHSAKPPIIVFMGDHGFREYPNLIAKNSPYYYMNMNAVYLPNKNYTPFYNGISSVNQFRALLNSSFGQQLPMVKDSAVFIRE